MPTTLYDTTEPQLLQPQQVSQSQQDWEDLLERLPKGWQAQARRLKAFRRTRELPHPAALLRGLLAYVLCVTSFRHLGCWSLLIGLADISDSAWRKRLRQSGDWLSWLVRELLAVAAGTSPWLLRGGWRRILLLDGTHLTCPGVKGTVWRLHCAFDLLAGRLSQLHITDTHVAEHVSLFEIQPGDLLVSDNANGYRDRLVDVLKRQADLVVRFTPKSLPMEDEQGQTLDLLRWLKGRHAPAGRVCERTVWIRWEGQR